MKQHKDKIFLSDLYVIEDGFLEALLVDDAENALHLRLLCPIFKSHPEYGNMLDKLRRYFSSGVYLNSDQRKINLNFINYKNLTREKLDVDEIDNSPARVLNWDIKLGSKLNFFKIETEEENIQFNFSNVEVLESKEVMFST